MAEDPSPDTDAPADPEPPDPAVERPWRPASAPDAAPERDADPDRSPDAPSGPEAERPSPEADPADETASDAAGQEPPAETPLEEPPTPPESGHRPDAEDESRPSDEPAADDPFRDASAPDKGPDPSTSAAPSSPDASPSTTSSAPAPNDDAPRTGEADDPPAVPSSAPEAGPSASDVEEVEGNPESAPDRPASGDAPPSDGADADEAPPDSSPPPAEEDDRSPTDAGPPPDSSVELPDAADASRPEDAPERIEVEGSQEADGDAPDRKAAREEGKQINEEAFADDADERSWTDRLDETNDRPDADRAPDRDDFYTDQRRGVRGAEQIEEELQDFVYEVNDGTADTDWTPSQVEARKTATMFAILVGKVAEDMSYQRMPGDEFWDPRKIMRRQIDNRPLRHCKMDYTKRRLALLVDTSPSCRDEAVFYSKIASGAMLRDDIDIFLCPNGRIDARFDPEPMRFVDDDRGADWALDGRTVLYFTDWDGADEIVTHSRACNLYWFDNCPPADYWESPRDRRQRVRLQYRGRHFHCPDPDAFRRLARKIRP
ncbi:MAG: hypothetical protein V5A48_01865 [Salinivenus sp.]